MLSELWRAMLRRSGRRARRGASRKRGRMDERDSSGRLSRIHPDALDGAPPVREALISRVAPPLRTMAKV
jgi:hypothetical protein